MKIIIFNTYNNDNISESFINFCKQNFTVVNIYNKSNIYKKQDFDLTVDFYISFLNSYICQYDHGIYLIRLICENKNLGQILIEMNLIQLHDN